MDKAEIDKLLELVDGTDKAALTVLYNAWANAFNAYKAESNKGTLAEWQAQEKALRARVDELTAKYIGPADARVFADRKEAWRFLRDEGYKVSAQTVYNAANKGKLVVQADGSVTESDALAYAAKHLKKVPGKKGKPDKTADDLASENLSMAQLKRRKLQFEFDRDQKLYIKKSDVRTEIAIKIAALDAGVRHFFRTFLPDWIRRVGGNPRKANMLLELIYAELDRLFNEIGRFNEIDVVVVKEIEGGAPVEPEDHDAGGVFALDGLDGEGSEEKENVDGVIGDA
jgi:hypothetical protein